MIEKDFINVIKDRDIDFFVNRIECYNPLTKENLIKMSNKVTEVTKDILPDQDIEVILKNRRISTPKQIVSKILSDYLPNKLSLAICDQLKVKKQIGDTSNQILKKVSNFVNNWTVVPSGTEGYKTAEVTLGGIDTKEISSSTMECKKHPGLYFIGEVLDVTGHLGGHNFQWAWSSGFLAGQYV